MTISLRHPFALLAVPLFASAAGPSTAEVPPATFAAGEVAPRVSTLHDPDQQYGLYLPAAYEPSRRWPVLFVLDPRGRALEAMDLFVEGAERHGWIVLSSYQSRSDTASSVTVDAFEALLADAQRRFPVDPRRLYLAGMSGTGFAAWSFAMGLTGHVAGVIGCGAGLPWELGKPGKEVPFAYFGIAGRHDFNYLRQLDLDEQLDRIGAAHAFEAFDGVHGWPPDPVLTGQAVDWMELQAMRAGLAPRRQEWIDTELARWSAAARAAPDPLTALHRYRRLVLDFDGLGDVVAARAELARIEQMPEVRKSLARERKLARQERIYANLLDEWIAETARATDPPPPPPWSLARLKVPALIGVVATADRATADSARRRLESAYVHLAYSLPREFEERDDLPRAAAMLELAVAIFPDRERAWRRLADIYTRSGREDKASVTLERMAASPSS